MKKMKFALLILLMLCPLNVLAYSDYIIPGGDNIGIEVKYDGVLVIGFYKIDNKYNKNVKATKNFNSYRSSCSSF